MSEIVKQEGDFKIKAKPKKPKKLITDNEVVKVEMPKVTLEEAEKVAPEVTKVEIKAEPKQEVQEVQEVAKVEIASEEPEQVMQEIIEEEVAEKVEQLEEQFDKALDNQQEKGKPLPENIEKLVTFMEETGGTLNDYVRLNTDYSNVNEDTLLKEYYKKTKPYLEGEDINLILEDFSYDEELDEERDIRKKKIAYKEEVAKARTFLEETKSKYYDEIKLRPGVTQDQQKATDFFNRYKEDQEAAKQRHNDFTQNTKNLLNEDFKGFDFNVGEKKFRYGVKNVKEVAEAQSDISNFIGKFLDKKGNIADTKGYHKALYAARNADTIAQHFYEQGKADAVKDVVAKSKNISTEPRKNSSGNVFINGLKVKAITGLDSSKLKVRTKKFN
jgi:hypothetical protein